MSKLKLQLDDLAVDSFTTSEAAGRLGTVQAHNNNTWAGQTCGAEFTCGPETCGHRYCVLGTDPVNCAGTGPASCAGCGPATVGCPTGGALSCVGCTTHDYTVNAAHDSCGFCQSLGSDVPQRCPCP